jgi:hypothetical protein
VYILQRFRAANLSQRFLRQNVISSEFCEFANGGCCVSRASSVRRGFRLTLNDGAVAAQNLDEQRDRAGIRIAKLPMSALSAPRANCEAMAVSTLSSSIVWAPIQSLIKFHSMRGGRSHKADEAEMRRRSSGDQAGTRRRSGGDQAAIRRRSGGDQAEIRRRSGGDQAEIRRRSGGDQAEIRRRSGGDQAEINAWNDPSLNLVMSRISISRGLYPGNDTCAYLSVLWGSAVAVFDS